MNEDKIIAESLIKNVSLNFEYMGLAFSIKVPMDGSNYPSTLARALKELIHMVGTHSGSVMEELMKDTGYSPTEIDV